MNKVLVIDPSIAGIAGDMLVAALIDLGANAKILSEIAQIIEETIPEVKEMRVKVVDVLRCGVRAKRLELKIKENKSHHIPGKKMILWLNKVLNRINLSVKARNLANEILNRLLEAEAKIHGTSKDEVHLHEIGSSDTIFDIVSTVALLESLKLLNSDKYSLPVAIGGGVFRAAHGLIPSPAYITLELLRSRNFYIVGGPIDQELTTPTGAALLTTLAKSVNYTPLMKVEKVGYGAGSRDYQEIANIVRVLLGTYSTEMPIDLKLEDVYILETNVDDVSGEVIGYVIRELISEGALDVSVIPVITKKNRPGYIIKVISDMEKLPKLILLLIQHLGTLGIRVQKVHRYIVPIREQKEVEIERGYIIRFKICKDRKGKLIRIKPEFDDVERLSRELKIPLSDVLSLINREMERLRKQIIGNQ